MVHPTGPLEDEGELRDLAPHYTPEMYTCFLSDETLTIAGRF